MTEKRNSFYLNIISQRFQMKKLKNSLLNFFNVNFRFWFHAERERHTHRYKKKEKKNEDKTTEFFFWF